MVKLRRFLNSRPLTQHGHAKMCLNKCRSGSLKKAVFQAALLLSALTSCENISSRPAPILLTERLYSLESIPTQTCVTRLDQAPRVQYLPLSSVFPDPRELLVTSNPDLALEKLRTVMSLSPEYHQELTSLLSDAKTIDFSHLWLFLDAFYFPAPCYEQLKSALLDPLACQDQAPQQCEERLNWFRANLKSSLVFSEASNQMLLESLEKLSLDSPLTGDQTERLFENTFPGPSAEPVMDRVLAKTLPLTLDEEARLFGQSIHKLAWNSARRLGKETFKNHSSHQAEELLLLLNAFQKFSPEFPLSASALEARSSLFFDSIFLLPELRLEDAKKLIALTTRPNQAATACLSRMTQVTVHQIAELAAFSADDTERETFILESLKRISSISTEDAIELLRTEIVKRASLIQTLLSKIQHFAPPDLISIAENALVREERDEMILNHSASFSQLEPDETKKLVNLVSPSQKLSLLSSLLSKTRMNHARDLVSIVSVLNRGDEKDRALLLGLEKITETDIPSIQGALRLAYREKLPVALALLAIRHQLTASELATVASDLSDSKLRDLLLLRGSASVSQASPEGLAEIVRLADQEKTRIAVALFPKVPTFSAENLVTVLTVVLDGKTRDAITLGALAWLQKVDGASASKVVEKCFEIKVQAALRLLALIPGSTGTDLDQVLAVCSSGLIRDQILAKAIESLNRITKTEGKALILRAYTNKDKIAALMISKIVDIEGSTIAEIAKTFSKGSSRDLIIQQGLNRLHEITAQDLISLISVADQLTETLALQVTDRIVNLTADDCDSIAGFITNVGLRDRFLIHAIDLIRDLDEPGITTLALAASSREAKYKIIEKGLKKIGDS